MKPIKSIEEWKAILKKAKEEHEKQELTNVSLKILEEVSEE